MIHWLIITFSFDFGRDKYLWALVHSEDNPFTPKAYIIRYWKKEISNTLPQSSFLINKASPLTAVKAASFSKLSGDLMSLSGSLPLFCSAANLLRFPDVGPSLEKHSGDVDFKEYSEKNFTNYGSGSLSRSDSFKNNSNDGNADVNSFSHYRDQSNVGDDNFKSYAKCRMRRVKSLIITGIRLMKGVILQWFFTIWGETIFG
ncbi:polygalacturonase 2 [Artemisia annua]|uniref:Polygalacturonase 2 n=1 Tax=Artemisia annua TaxID=35608 RepID=A0A2U1P2Q3_ARTAN|nr:polygalacturonase 2 [Artemisia annua]